MSSGPVESPAIDRHTPARLWLVPVLIVVLGTAGSWTLSQAFRRDALRAWQGQAEQAARWLSGTLLSWLEESYAPISGLAILAENSETLEEWEFLNGIDDMEARATAFFLDSAAYLRRGEDGDPEMIYSTDSTGPLASGAETAIPIGLSQTAQAAFDEPDRILLGRPLEREKGPTVSIVVLSIEERDGTLAVVAGLVNYDALVEGLFEQHVPAGFSLQIAGKFLGGEPITVYGESNENSLYSVTTRTISADADLSITWAVDADFEGGPAYSLSHVVLVAGTTVNAVIALFIGMLLRRNQLISLRIREATRELARSRDAAEVANRAKSAFLANMSHELRTPMNAILGYSEMLIEEAEDDGDESAIEDLKRIHAAGSHLLSLINDVLDLSKIEAGRMEVVLDTFPVSELIDEVVSTIDGMVKKNDNQLQVEVDPSLGVMRADLTKVRQALFNLLSNAAKFTTDGAIRLVAQAESVQGEPWIRMSVTDSGIGISPEKFDLVFEEFSQAEDSTSRRYGGTGLGLPISRRFCQMMGGDITVESSVGEGSTFTIHLPLTVRLVEGSSAAETGKTPAVVPEPGSDRTVLVVDDDPVALDLIGRTLQRADVRVVTTGSGREALRLASSLRPAVITLDVIMPDMDGWEVLRELKQNPDTHDIPVIMLTMTQDQSLGYAMGATEFLTKPVQRVQLVQILERHGAVSGAPRRRALVVDDHAENRSVLRAALENEGWEVHEAENGRIALDQVMSAEPSLILLDLMMPVMDGFEFVMEMRKLETLRAIPIVVVTAKDLTEDDRRRLSQRVMGLIERRGLDLDALLAQVRQQLPDDSGS